MRHYLIILRNLLINVPDYKSHHNRIEMTLREGQWVEIVGPHVKKVHFKDWSRKNRDWPPLLEGDVDWPKVMKALRDVGATPAW